MVELMEPKTSFLEPGSVTLRNADLWHERQGIRAFLDATQRLSLDKLVLVSPNLLERDYS